MKKKAEKTIESGRKISLLMFLGGLILFASLFSFIEKSLAAVNREINYQGKLTDSTGYVVSDGNYDMRFSIYDSYIGGNLLWTGNYTAANGNAIQTSRGIFSILLGSGTGNALNLDFNTDSYYLEVEIYNTDTSLWETFNNRKKFGSVPQSVNSLNVVGNGYLDIDNTSTVQDALNINYNPASGSNDAAEINYGSGGGTGTALKVNQAGSGNIIQFQKNGSDEFTIENDGATDFHNNEAKQFRVENGDASVLTPTCDSTTQGRMYYDTSADAAFVCIETSPSVYGWFNYTSTTVQSNKVVTVGTGGDYTTLSAGAAYLNTLGGGIILLTPETHNVNSSVDLDNISLIGANTGDTRINITGSGSIRVKETQFKSMTIYIDSAITGTSGIDAKYSAATTSSIIFEWVDFITNGTKVLINSSESTAPTVRTRFISTSTTSGTQKIFLPKATANLNANSTHFVESQGGSGTLDIEDWNVKIAGSSNVKTTGTIETIPDSTIFVYPGMNLQGAINSISSGGVITLLPGVHTISSSVLILRDDIQIEGYGDASILRASGFTGGDTVAAIQIGSTDGSAPNDGVVLRDFKLEVSGTGASDIHGIRMAGGEDNQIQNVTLLKTAGASGTAAGARMGMLLMDGTGEKLVRPVVKGCRVLGTQGVGAYFTDGIHVTGGASYGAGSGIFTNGQGIEGALIEGNYVDYVRETVAVFVGVNNSSLFNNRFSRMGAGGTGAFGVFFGNSSNVNMTANVVATSLSAASYGIVIDSLNSGSLKQVTDSVFTSNAIDGSANSGVGFAFGVNIGNASNTAFHRNVFTNNTINGASNAVTTALTITGDADDNNISNNIINGVNNPWDTGINIVSATAERNFIGKNALINTTINVADTGAGTQLGMSQHNAAVAPTANDDSADGYQVGTVWVNTATQNAYILTNVTAGAAVWEQIDATGGSGTADLDSVYNNDSDKVMNIGNDAGLEFVAATGGNVTFDLQGSGGFVIQDNDSTFLTISDTGGFDYILDSTDNPSFAINNLGTGAFRINDQSGDTTPFIIDQDGNVGIGIATGTDKLNISQSVSTASQNGLGISYAQNANAANLAAAALNVLATSSGDAGDTLYGINIDDITSTNSSEIGLRFGTGWDYELSFADATPSIRIQDGAVLNIDDSTGNNLLLANDLNTNFGMSVESGAFIDRNSYIGEEFSRYRNTLTTSGGVSGTGSTANLGYGWGDNQGLGVNESTACSFSTPTNSLNGTGRLATAGGGTHSCLAYHGTNVSGTIRALFNVTNLPVFLMKVKPEVADNNNRIWMGMSNAGTASATEPSVVGANSGIYFSNTGNGTTYGTGWYGITRNAGSSTYVNCNTTVSTTNFALLKAEVVSSSQVNFFIDPDTSDGIDWTSCGSSTTNIPTADLSSMMKMSSTKNGNYVDVDFVRYWQDDNNVGNSVAEISSSDSKSQEAIEANNISEYYRSDDPNIPEGTLVSLDEKSNFSKIKPASLETAFIGIVSNNSAMELSDGSSDGVKVATFGRAKIRINNENGAIKVGDYLTASGTLGVATKAVKTGEVIGRALQNFDSEKEGLITVLINRESINLTEENNINDEKKKSSGLDTDLLDSLSAQGSLMIDKPVEFQGPAMFKAMAEFFDKVVFGKDAIFKGKLEAIGGAVMGRTTSTDVDSSGYAVIKKGSRTVEIKFENKYEEIPIVTANLMQKENNDELDEAVSDLLLLSDIKFMVTKVSEKGFVIKIDQPAVEDVNFAWHVSAVKNAKTFEGNSLSHDSSAELKVPDQDQEEDENIKVEISAEKPLDSSTESAKEEEANAAQSVQDPSVPNPEIEKVQEITWGTSETLIIPNSTTYQDRNTGF